MRWRNDHRRLLWAGPDRGLPETRAYGFLLCAHAKSIKWTGQKVTITFVVTNQNTQPASFANPSVTGYMGIVLMSLQSANGTKYDPAVSGMPFSIFGPFSDNLNPGMSKEGIVVFEVPPGEYTFHADRSVTYTATVGVGEKHFEPYVCKIPAI